jgi:D-sedoheptulose 7-phosphate isomerase
MTLAETIELYLTEKRRILETFPVEAVAQAANQLFETYDSGGTVYAMANGGNAGTLDHCYCDFRHHPFVSEDKRTPLPGTMKRLAFVNLCSSPAEVSGLVNDFGADDMYVGSLIPFLTSADLVMAYSGSGNSPNVVRALEAAVAAGAKTFAMTKGDGGRCRELADVCLVEDAMLSVNHILVGLLRERVIAGLGSLGNARE